MLNGIRFKSNEKSLSSTPSQRIRRIRSLFVATIIWFIFTQQIHVIGTYNGISRCWNTQKRNKKKDCLLNFSLVLICTQCSHKPALVPMMESSLWEIAQHCHDKDFWTEDRFDYKFLSVCQLLIIHRVGGFRRWSSKNETEKWKISFKYVNKKNLNTLTATTNIFESGFHSMKQFMPYFEIDSGVRFVITIGTQGYVK